MREPITVIDVPEAAHAALSPIRRSLLSLLGEPASASELAERLGTSRQRVGYHLGVLADHGLVEPAGERRKRGFVERRFRRVGTAVLSPDLVAPAAGLDARDRDSAAAVVAAAADAVRAVGELAPAAAAAGLALVTMTARADVAFASPAALRAFAAEFAELAARYDRPDAPGARTQRVTLLAHPVAHGEHDA